jgi:hypothetical protein
MFLSISRQLSNFLQEVQNAHKHVWKETNQTKLTDVGNAEWIVDLDHEVSTIEGSQFLLDDNETSTHPKSWKTLSVVGKNSTQESDRKSKPWLILHIGPPKTGTTSIQCGLEEYSRHLKQLDNYFYLGIKCWSRSLSRRQPRRKSRRQNTMPNNETPIRGTSLALYMNGALEQTEAIFQVFQRLNQHREQSHNVIISSEHLLTATSTNSSNQTDAYWTHFKSLITGFNVRAVVVNRFLLDWLPSKYYQMFYSTTKGTIPSFQSFLKSALSVLENKKGRQRHPYNSLNVWSKVEIWSHHFDLDFMDFYSETYDGDIFQNFICDHTPDASKTCQLLTSKKQESLKASTKSKKHAIHARASTSLEPLKSYFYAKEKYAEFQNISTTVENASRYLYPTNASAMVNYRSRYIKNAKLVFEEHDLLSNPYFLDCISADLEAKFKNYSIILMQAFHEKKHGRQMTPQELVKGMTRHHEVFEKNMAMGKYCQLNLERVFLNDTIASALMDF